MTQANQRPNQPPPMIVATLDVNAYKRIESQCMPVLVGKDTTELQGGVIIGQQSVLKMLREGFVVGM